MFIIVPKNENSGLNTQNHLQVRDNWKDLCKYFLSAFAKLRTAIVSFVMSVSLFVRIEELDYYWRDFHEILYFSVIRKYFRKLRFDYNVTNITCTLNENERTFIIIFRRIFPRIRNKFRQKF